MFFLIGMLIFTIAAIAVTYKVLLGYTALSFAVKLPILLLLIAAWFSPLLISGIRHLPAGFNGLFYVICYKVSYFLLGFCLVLFMILVARDILWQICYIITKNKILDPDNAAHIQFLNIIAIGITFAVCLYGVWAAHHEPLVKHLTIEDEKIKEPVKIVMASDLHINQTSSVPHIQKMIDQINAQNPDYILLGGDIADDDPKYAKDKIQMLSKLKAKKVYISLGNHEFYHHPHAWMLEFNNLGFLLLHNTGEELEQTGVFVGGVPDIHSTNQVNYQKALGHDRGKYKVLLSHTPAGFKDLDKNLFDIQLSGHTHGAQIFPFQFLTKRANNGYLSGLYEENGTKLFVSNGAGYWGIPMRILAPADIVVLDLKPKNE